MNARTSRILFFSGVALFLLAKLYLVIPASLALSVPRLGDDSLVYLLKAKQAIGVQVDRTPALRDIAEQFHQPDGTEAVRWMRSNVAQRSLPSNMLPTYNVLMKAALALTDDLRWAFALTELLGIGLLTFGMAWLLLEIVGPSAAGLALYALAFAILPNQGIYSFIPSTFALSCSLILWAYIWKKGENASAIGIGIATLAILGLHPIAKAYVALTPMLYWIRLNAWSAWRGWPFWRIALACGASIALAQMLPSLIPVLRPPPSEIMGGLDIIEGARRNLEAVFSLSWDPIVRFNLPWALMVFGTILFAPRLIFSYPFGILIAGTVALLGASLLFWLPGYPGELFSRFWVLFVLLTSAIGARFMLSLWNEPGLRQRMFKWSFVVLLALSSLVWVFKYVPNVMNWRTEVIDEPLIAAELDSFPVGTTLLYAEANTAMQASLLLGAQRLGAIAYPMSAGTSHLDVLVRERRPAAIVLPPVPELNSLAQARYKWFKKRRQGLYAGVVSDAVIRRNGGEPFERISILMAGEPGVMHWEATNSWGRVIAQGELNWPEQATWVSLNLPADAESVRVGLADRNAWILGLAAGEPKEKVFWPWETRWALTYGLRGKAREKAIHLDFSIASLLDRVEAAPLIHYVASSRPVLSDAGGLIFLRAHDATSSTLPDPSASAPGLQGLEKYPG